MVQDDKGKDKKIILFTYDITVTIKFNGNFKNNHLQAIIEKIWFEGDFIWLDNDTNEKELLMSWKK